MLAQQGALKTSALGLCYSNEEYSSSVWGRTVKINIHLSGAMRIISGALKSTPLIWLPTMSTIALPDL